MTNPTRQEIIDAHDAAEKLAKLAARQVSYATDEEIANSWKKQILEALPPRPRPTMAEVEWDDDKHFLAEAEHANDYTVMMLKPMRLEPGIKCLVFHGGDFRIAYSDPKDLTPTGKRCTLTEVQDEH